MQTVLRALNIGLILVGAFLLAGMIARARSEATQEGASISRSEYVLVNGAKLYLLTRGANRRAPVLLWLHGGPGGAERPLFRYFNSELETHFVVVYWDQRGAGRSFDPEADPRRLTVKQHIADLDAVVDHLRRRLGREKIALIGHSWGTALGLLYARDHPDTVSAFIGVNQLVSMRESQRAEYEFVQAEASRRRDNDALVRLREIGPPPFITVDHEQAMEALADGYGGVFHKEPNRMWVMVRGVFSGLVTPSEIARIHRGIHVSLQAMSAELLDLDLMRSVGSVNVPVLFFLGRHDRHVDSRLAAAYFEALEAPVKRLIWFEHSAHNVPFEEARLFNDTVVRELQSIGIQPLMR